MKSIITLLSSGLTGSDGLGSMVNKYLRTTPSVLERNLWDTVQAVSENAIVPIALTIVAIVSVSDMFQMVTSGNNMRDFDTSIFFKWIVKTQIAITLVSKSFNFVTLVFSQGTIISQNAFASIGIGDLASSADLDTVLTETLKDYDISKLLFILALAFITVIAVYALFAVIIVVLCSRTIEAVMYFSISPIPMATFMNNEFRQVGNSWARGIFALAFQTFFIIIALAFFNSLFTGIITDIENKKDILWSMVKMSGYSIALIFTVLRTGQISKTMFSAH